MPPAVLPVCLAEPALRIDLHCHSRWSPDSRTSLEELIQGVKRSGIDALALTDHDAIGGAVELRSLAPFPVIVGEEIRTEKGEIIGLFLSELIPPGLSPEETLGRIRAQGGIAFVPHPFDAIRSSSTLAREALVRIAPDIDALEVFNSRCLFPRFNTEAAAFATRNGLPGLGGSDAHSADQVGLAWTDLPDIDIRSADAFRAALSDAKAGGVRLGVAGRLAPSAARLAKLIGDWRSRVRPSEGETAAGRRSTADPDSTDRETS